MNIWLAFLFMGQSVSMYAVIVNNKSVRCYISALYFNSQNACNQNNLSALDDISAMCRFSGEWKWFISHHSKYRERNEHRRRARYANWGNNCELRERLQNKRTSHRRRCWLFNRKYRAGDKNAKMFCRLLDGETQHCIATLYCNSTLYSIWHSMNFR